MTPERDKAEALCKGSYALGTACGHCSRCAEEHHRLGRLSDNAEISRLTAELNDALSEVEELQSQAEVVAEEFEKDCWKAMQSLLKECHFDWRDVEPGGVTADDAREYISTTLDEMEKAEKRNLARATAAEQRAEALLAEALQWKNMYLVAAERYTAAEQRLEAAERALREICKQDRVTRFRGTEQQFYEDGPCGKIAARALSGQTEKQGGADG